MLPESRLQVAATVPGASCNNQIPKSMQWDQIRQGVGRFDAKEQGRIARRTLRPRPLRAVPFAGRGVLQQVRCQNVRRPAAKRPHGHTLKKSVLGMGTTYPHVSRSGTQMKILDEIDVSEGRIKQTRMNIAIQEDRISDNDAARASVVTCQAQLIVLENDLASYVAIHKKLLAIAVAEFRRERLIDILYPSDTRLH